MTGMKIDLNIIRGWVRKWEGDGRGGKTASQVAAVMLSKALAENETRAARVEKVMNQIIVEGKTLNRIEKRIVFPKKAINAVALALLEECQKHKRRMAAILHEADELLKETAADQSIQVGGLLLEIGRQKKLSKDELLQARPSS